MWLLYTEPAFWEGNGAHEAGSRVLGLQAFVAIAVWYSASDFLPALNS